MVDSLLNGFRALDLTDKKGFVCGKILASLGVDVIKIEKPGGDPSRDTPPVYHHNSRQSLNWLAFNAGKRGITLNLSSNRGQELFRTMAKSAEFIIESFAPGYLDTIGIGYKTLSQLNPGIIMTSITHFGQEGPYANYEGSELIDAAMSGVMESNGDPDRPPLREAPDSAYYHANVAAALGTVMAHYYRQASGQGQQIDISIQEVAASRNTVPTFVWEFDKRLIKRAGPMSMLGAHPNRWIFPCKDGHLFLSWHGGPMGASSNEALSAWIDEEKTENPLKQVKNWSIFDLATTTKETRDSFEKTMVEFFSSHIKKEINEQALKRGIRMRAISDPKEVFESEQLNARDFWLTINSPELSTTLSYPKYFFLTSETSNFIKGTAPGVGQHNHEIYGKEMSLPSTELEDLKVNGII